MVNSPYIYPAPTWDCNWKCDYQSLCIAANRGDDVEFLKKAMFQKKELESESVYNRETTND